MTNDCYPPIGCDCGNCKTWRLSDGYDDGMVDAARPALPVRWVAEEPTHRISGGAPEEMGD